MCFCGCLYVHHMLICTQDGQKRASESLDLELHTCSWALQFWCQELQSFAGTAMTLTLSHLSSSQEITFLSATLTMIASY